MELDREIKKHIRDGQLLGQYLSDRADENEKKQTESWLQEETHRQLAEDLSSPESVNRIYRFYRSVNPDREFRLFRQKRRRRQLLRFLPYLSAAAVVTVVLTAVWSHPDPHPLPAPAAADVQNSIPAGTSKAILILENNRQIALGNDETPTGENLHPYATSNHVRLTYRQPSGDTAEPEAARHRLLTPVGGEYQLMLSDGTRVWLNANTELSYPVRFTGNTREVLLHGEAYFEVSPDPNRPFRVRTEQFSVVVTGTAFDVSVYPEDRHHRVTLVQGGVNIVSDHHLLAALSPGKQIDFNTADGRFEITDADTEAVTAWKKGLFLFREETLASITRKLGRWYNVQFILKGQTEDKIYSGTIQRDQPLEQTLNILKLTGEINFNIKNSREIEVTSIP